MMMCFEVLGRVDQYALPKSLPLAAGYVRTGFPSPADDDLETELDLVSHLIQHPSATFYVRAKGDSMEGEGIFDGDLLVVDRSLEPKVGNILIMTLDNEMTCKRLGMIGNRPYLIPANPNYNPIPMEGHECHVQKTRERSKAAFVAIAMTPALDDLIQRSRQLPPVSPFIVHRSPKRISAEARKREHWSSVTPDMISREFAKLRSKVASITALPAAAQPTFHEIRSLGSRLLELKGVPVSDIQVLMGHADEEMTQHYLDGHGARWQQAKGNVYDMGALLAIPKPSENPLIYIERNGRFCLASKPPIPQLYQKLKSLMS